MTGEAAESFSHKGDRAASAESMTAQAHEQLLLDGRRESMAFCPPLPDGHARIMQTTRETMSDSDADVTNSSACWRRYVGTWEIRDDRLFLIGLVGRVRLVGREPLFADWFTGVLRVLLGTQLLYVHMGFGSVYEEELHIRVEQGHIVARRTIDNRGRQWNRQDLAIRNFPGGENDFDGDDYWD
jgi:hypothetical protein